MSVKTALWLLLILSNLTFVAGGEMVRTVSFDSVGQPVGIAPTQEENTPNLQTLDMCPSVSISELQSRVLAIHPAIAALDERIRAADGTALQESLPYNPTVGYAGEEMGTPGGGAGKQGIVFSQEFRTGDKRALARNAGAWVSETLVHRRDALAQGVANEVRRLAYRLLAARRLVSVRENLLHLAAATEKQAQALRSVDEMSEMDLLQLTVQKNAAAMALRTAEREWTAAERELAILLGADAPPIGEISDPLEEPLEAALSDESTLLSAILAESPAIRQAEALVEQKQAALSLEMANARPNVSADGGVFFDAADNATLALAGLSVPLQIFDRNQGNIQRARSEALAARRDAENLRLEIARKAAQTYRDGVTARQEALTYRDEILPALKKSYEMNFQGFRIAQIGFLEMSNSQTAYFEASAAYVESLLRLSEAVALLDGMLLETGGDF